MCAFVCMRRMPSRGKGKCDYVALVVAVLVVVVVVSDRLLANAIFMLNVWRRRG